MLGWTQLDTTGQEPRVRTFFLLVFLRRQSGPGTGVLDLPKSPSSIGFYQDFLVSPASYIMKSPNPNFIVA